MSGRTAAGPATLTTFRYAFPFLRAERRRDLRTVYAFCRATDDIADGEGDAASKADRLRGWAEELERALAGKSGDPILAELGAVTRARGIPPAHYRELIRGAAMDIGGRRYDTFGELLEYCRCVASSVGLMCLDIFGRRTDRTEEYARALGVALQLTNIIRDVGADAVMGRIYLPSEEIARFGCAPDDILSLRDTPEFRRLMEFQGERAAEWYRSAESILEREDRPAMRPAIVMGAVYRRTLDRIRRVGYDVLGRRIRLPRIVLLATALRHGLLPPPPRR